MTLALQIAPEALSTPAGPDAEHDVAGGLAGGWPDDSWADQALCKGQTELFFGAPRERPERRARREGLARRYCQVCPVMSPCRAVARSNGENGFWGGESEEERALAGFPPKSISRRGVLAASRARAS